MTRYKTIVIDPPWEVKNGFKMSQGTPLKETMPYKTMSLSEILDFPINNYSNENCDLFLWTTHSMLPFCFEILKKWGFKYHCLLTWDKEQGLTLFGIHRRTELCLYGFKGRMGINQTGKALSTMFKELKTKHSAKPRIFYEQLIKHTQEPRIDIFSRKKHFGFDSFGDEVENHLTLEAWQTK